MWRFALILTMTLGGALACRHSFIVVPPPLWVVEARTEIHRTRNAFFDRATELVTTLDDKVSDASTMALALSVACGPEYDAYARARAVLLGQSDRQREDRRRALGSPKEKIRAALPIIQAHRAGQPLKRKDYPG